MQQKSQIVDGPLGSEHEPLLYLSVLSWSEGKINK